MRQVVKHLFFTFGFLYLILYNLPAVFDVLPFTGAAAALVQSGWDAVVPRVALSIFHVSATTRSGRRWRTAAPTPAR